MGDMTTWEHWMPVSKKEAITLLSRDLPPGLTVDIDVDANGHGGIEIIGDGVEEKRRFSLPGKVLCAGRIILAKTGTGLGRIIMRNEIEFFSTCGIRRFEIFAGEAAGGYAWARFGFAHDRKDQYYVAILKGKLMRRYQAIERWLEPAEKDKLLPLLSLQSPHSVGDIANRETNIKSILRNVFNTVAAKDQAYVCLDNVLIEATQRSLVEHIETDTPLPLGRFLLSRTFWDGYLDFTDKEQMTHVEKYVGGFNQPLGTIPKEKRATAKTAARLSLSCKSAY